MPLQRLQKIISSAGIASRRKAEELIIQGRVRVNRKTVVEPGTRADPERDRIEVDGKVISLKGPRVYILLNKPRGFISAVSDPRRRPVVTDLLKRVRERVYPVGRLDFDSEGALLLTNDGELAGRLIHPRYRVPKKYLVKVSDVPDERDLERLRKGVLLEDGRTLPARVRLVRKTKKNSWLEITVSEGRNRLIRRMCGKVGHPVLKLKRTSFAGIGPGRLRPGEWRYLRPDEVKRLKKAAGLDTES